MPRWTPGPKLTPKIILEGTRLTHKTDLAFAINDHPRIVGPRAYRYHPPLVSAEWEAFTPYPWCVRREDTFEAARAERLKVSGKPAQYDDLAVFAREQEVLRGLAVASRLPVLELDVSDDDVAGAADRVADWMTETGGLWAPGPNERP